LHYTRGDASWAEEKRQKSIEQELAIGIGVPADAFSRLREKTQPFRAGGRVRCLANYAPLNYEWHGIMEIINSALGPPSRCADPRMLMNRRDGLLLALMRRRASSAGTGTRSQQSLPQLPRSSLPFASSPKRFRTP